ncbi:MAG: hypothetical protein H6854_05420 [Rhodospirillales bacterium]|nr:hypothetical protein [Rhodospirillales bacterium]
MNKKFLTLVCAACLTSVLPSPASADPKPWIFSWGFGHFETLDFSQPYLERSKDVHDRQWDREKWSPDVWIQQSESGLDLIDGFYRAGIIMDQTVKGGVPYLHVGPNFYKLGGYDKRRVMRSVDEVYKITSLETDDMFYLYDDCKDRIIGLYTRNGLQIQ